MARLALNEFPRFAVREFVPVLERTRRRCCSWLEPGNEAGASSCVTAVVRDLVDPGFFLAVHQPFRSETIEIWAGGVPGKNRR